MCAQHATHLRKRHNGDEAEHKAQRSVPVQVVRDEAQGDEDEEHVEPGAQEEVLVGRDPPGLALGLEERGGLLREGARGGRGLLAPVGEQGASLGRRRRHRSKRWWW